MVKHFVLILELL